MKKSTFLLAMLAMLTPAVFYSCPEPEIPKEDDPFVSDVKWSADWKYVTIYLEGELPDPDDPDTPPATPSAENVGYNGVNRAMTLDTVRVAFDYFEVVFYHSQNIARSSWEIGARAIVTDVYREGGVDYSRTGAAGLSASQGAAILFAGRMVGRTVMAFGKIISVDEVPGALIKEDSHRVTFELFALTAAVSVNKAKSSFQMDDMETKNALIGGRPFPLYVLPLGKANINASYEFKLTEIRYYEENEPERTLAPAERDAFLSGVIVGESGPLRTKGEAFNREARYPRGSGNYWYADYAHDTTTTVTMTNNQSAGQAAVLPVAFTIDTTNTYNPAYEANGIFILCFDVPVYAMVRALDPEAVELWHIRAAYQSYNYNIDNGLDSVGGGVLMGAVDPRPNEFDVGRIWW